VHRFFFTLSALLITPGPDDEHGTLRGQIEQLKTALEHAQLQRRRKIEYDLIAEKINTLPSREELEQ
jgi:THO complex subunit 7